MPVRSKKERIFRHMARDVSDVKRVWVDRDDLIDQIAFGGRSNPDTKVADLVDMHLKNWVRLVKIKYGECVEIDIFTDYDIDFNRYRFGGRVRFYS